MPTVMETTGFIKASEIEDITEDISIKYPQKTNTNDHITLQVYTVDIFAASNALVMQAGTAQYRSSMVG